MSHVFDPFNPRSPPAPRFKTVRETELEAMMRESLPYLMVMEAEQDSEKLTKLVASFLLETHEGDRE